MTRNIGAIDHWRFPWLKFRSPVVVEWVRPEGAYAALASIEPSFRRPILRVTNWQDPVVYYPLEDKPMGRKQPISRAFADVTTPTVAAEFASEYGLLGFEAANVAESARNEARETHNEDVQEWLNEARALKRAYGLYDFWADANAKELRKIIQWRNGCVFAKFPEGSVPIVHGPINSDYLKVWKKGDVLEPAKLFIVEEYNRHLQSSASPMLLLDAHGNFLPYSQPASLLAALWLEFGEVVTGRRRQITCRICKGIMDVTSNSRNKETHDQCSLKLRMARWRKRSHDVETETAQTRKR